MDKRYLRVFRAYAGLNEEDQKLAKIKRDAFLYLDPAGDKDRFAQCGTCSMFTGSRCSIMGPKVKIAAGMSCGYYIHGKPDSKMEVAAMVTPEEAGLVDRQVRCENCRSFDDGKCQLFAALNKQLGDYFGLDEKVDPKGCCNAQEPK